jgi:ABC-type sulfate transport system permease subunit
MRRALPALALALAGIVCWPGVAHAWTPGTHIFLGESVLANLVQLPAAVASLLRAFPYDFLYRRSGSGTSPTWPPTRSPTTSSCPTSWS